MTHGLHFLDYCDRVVVVDSGKIIAEDTYKNLKENKDFIKIVEKIEEEAKEQVSEAEIGTRKKSKNTVQKNSFSLPKSVASLNEIIDRNSYNHNFQQVQNIPEEIDIQINKDFKTLELIKNFGIF